LAGESQSEGVLKKSQEYVGFARELRQKHTDAEKALWMKLRNRQLEGVKFRGQQPIGPYIVDFVSFQRRLIVEIDGGQHNEDRTKERDEERTIRLEQRGYRIVRFWYNEVLTNPEGVLERIRERNSKQSCARDYKLC
jgi:very-short-patch-repair endonuclease